MPLPLQKTPLWKFLMTSLHVICGLGPPPIKNPGYAYARYPSKCRFKIQFKYNFPRVQFVFGFLLMAATLITYLFKSNSYFTALIVLLFYWLEFLYCSLIFVTFLSFWLMFWFRFLFSCGHCRLNS